MTSDGGRPEEAFVWAWLAGESEPVIAGRLHAVDDVVEFNYGRSYLGRSGVTAIYLPELPLRPGAITPRPPLLMAGAIADAGPDSWGQRVIMNRLLGRADRDADPADLSPLTYLLESDSDRAGALDFQRSPSDYLPRRGTTSDLTELMEAATLVEEGRVLPPALADALLAGSSIGGARPKVTLRDGERSLIAKFSARDDRYPVEKGEFVAMTLAARAGLEVAAVSLTRVLGRDVLLVGRFDRPGAGRRRAMVSALTLFGLEEMMARYGSYAELAEILLRRSRDGVGDVHELFRRLTFNVLVGNTDDHARNHSAFWDGAELELTPAYDIAPQLRSGGEATQALPITRDGARYSRVVDCIAAAPSFRLSAAEALEMVDAQIATIESDWEEVCDLGGLTEADRAYFWHRQFLNPYALEGHG